MKKLRIAYVLLPVAAALAVALSCQRSLQDDDQAQRADTEPATALAYSLSNQRINCIAEDRLGHIWLATFRGLNRWNADDFHQYFATADTSSLPDNQILHLCVDTKGRLWVSTMGGVALYTDRDNFRRIDMDNRKSHPVQVVEAPDGQIYMAQATSVSRFNPETERFEVVLSGLRQDKPFGQECVIDRYNRLLVVDDHALRVFDTQRFAPIDTVALGYEPTAIWLDPRSSRLWVAGDGRIDVFDTYTRRREPTPRPILDHPGLAGTTISIIRPWNNNVMLFNSLSDGLYAYDQLSGRVVHQSEAGFPFEAPDFNINALFNDSKGNLWIGAYDHGFEVRHTGRKQFNNDNALNLLARNKSVLSVVTDADGSLWVGMLGGDLLRYDPQTKTSSRVMLSTPRGPVAPAPWALHIDSKGYLWDASLMSGKIYRCRPSANGLQVVNTYDVTRPLTFAEASDGAMLVSTGSDGMVRISPDGATCQVVRGVLGGSGFITGMVPIDDGNMLAVSFGHPLYRLDTKTLQANTIDIDRAQWERCIGSSTFIPTALYKDADGVVWIGTLGNGLLCYDPATGCVEPVLGAACSDIAAIQQDRQGNLWVSTQSGLSRYDHTTGRFSNFYETDGTGGNQYYDRAACLMPDGTLIFGGTHGLTAFNPMDVGAKRTVPIVFEDLKVHNTLVTPAEHPEIIDRQLSFTPQINLDYLQNGFSISFAALDYIGQERVHYFYKLDGRDKYWIEANNNREAYYANLAPGKYTFRVRIDNSNNSIIDSESAIDIVLQPAPWRRWWAILIYVLVLIGLIWGIAKVRAHIISQRAATRRAEQEKEQEKRVNRMNMSFFANISHEFRTPLTMISGPLNQLQDSPSLTPADRSLIQITRHSVDRMLRLVNQLMDFNKLENDTLRLQVDRADVVEYLRAMVNVFVYNAANKGIELTTSGLEDSCTSLVDCDKLEKIVSNLLGNAIKFTPSGGSIQLDFDVVPSHSVKAPDGVKVPQGQLLKITVSDTGPGIPADLHQRVFDRYYQLDKQTRGDCNWGTGIGLYYVRALAELHHGCVYVTDRNDQRSATGAVFTVLLPASDSAYAESERATAPMPLPVAEAAEQAPAAEPDAAAGKPVVLAVDDDSEVLNYVSTLLSPYFQVVTAHDAASALQLVADTNPALVITDVVMPGMSGYDLCRRIKDDPQLCHIPVILVTAKAAIESQVEGLNTGADAYVTKPFDPKYLVALIKSQLANRARVRDLLSKSTETRKIEPDVLSAPDKAFMDTLYALMEAELSNTELDINSLTEKLRISRTKLYYKVKGLTGANPAAFFKTYKLNRAAELLASGQYTVSEIADMTGFSTLAHFSTSFKKQFGVSPTAWHPTN